MPKGLKGDDHCRSYIAALISLVVVVVIFIGFVHVIVVAMLAPGLRAIFRAGTHPIATPGPTDTKQ